LGIADVFAPLMMLLGRFNGSRPIYTRVMLRALRSNRQVSYDRATHELGYSVRPTVETIADTLTWFQKNGLLRKNAVERR
jgi:nucleoside-diphosphate-sugar epimerase